jgi:hypothetical protein
MNETRQKLKRLLRQHVPDLAEALGGPFAGAAAEVLSRAVLGRADGSEDELAEVLEREGEALAPQLREAALTFSLAALQASTAARRIDAADRADARARQAAMSDRIPGFLAAVILAGFFCVLAVMLTREVPQGIETEFSIMLGALSTMAAAVMNYYFGSSAGSRQKTLMLGGGEVQGRGHKPPTIR